MPAFQTSNKTPNTNYKNRNHTDKSARITTSTPRGAGRCCLHNSSLPLCPRQCCSHALQNSSKRREIRGCLQIQKTAYLHPGSTSPGRTGVRERSSVTVNVFSEFVKRWEFMKVYNVEPQG